MCVCVCVCVCWFRADARVIQTVMDDVTMKLCSKHKKDNLITHSAGLSEDDKKYILDRFHAIIAAPPHSGGLSMCVTAVRETLIRVGEDEASAKAASELLRGICFAENRFSIVKLHHVRVLVYCVKSPVVSWLIACRCIPHKLFR